MRKIYQSKGLIISRIPQKKRQLFIELANEDFCGDYGMCLASLLDYVITLQPLSTRVDALELEVSKLNQPHEEKKEVKKLMDGKELK
jgi:hypothetical protein